MLMTYMYTPKSKLMHILFSLFHFNIIHVDVCCAFLSPMAYLVLVP